MAAQKKNTNIRYPKEKGAVKNISQPFLFIRKPKTIKRWEKMSPYGWMIDGRKTRDDGGN